MKSERSTGWSWQAYCPSPARGDDRATRRRATIQALVVAVIALVLYRLAGRPMAGCVLGGVAFALLVCGWAAPSFYRRLEHTAQRLAMGLGTVLTWILLTPVYLLVFTPRRFWLRWAGKDRLRLRFPTDRSSDWSPYPERPDPESYRHQY